jgi:hypothetical protein
MEATIVARIWDEFLSERDKAHLAAAEPRKRVGFGSRPAVLMIDNYAGVFSEPGVPFLEAVKTNRSAMGEDANIAAAHIARLLEHSRGAGIPVIHITGMHGNNMPGWHRTRSKKGALRQVEHLKKNDNSPGKPTGQETAPPIRRRLIALTIAEIRRLLNLIHHGEHAITHGLHWSTWRRLHQAQARRAHVQRRLRLQTLMI